VRQSTACHDSAQSEYATDVLFRSREALRALYPRLLSIGSIGGTSVTGEHAETAPGGWGEPPGTQGARLIVESSSLRRRVVLTAVLDGVSRSIHGVSAKHPSRRTSSRSRPRAGAIGSGWTGSPQMRQDARHHRRVGDQGEHGHGRVTAGTA
jgi:hypothetical protein